MFIKLMFKTKINNNRRYVGILIILCNIAFNLSFLLCWCRGKGSSCSWSYGWWIYNYLCNQFLSPLNPFTDGCPHRCNTV